MSCFCFCWRCCCLLLATAVVAVRTAVGRGETAEGRAVLLHMRHCSFWPLERRQKNGRRRRGDGTLPVETTEPGRAVGPRLPLRAGPGSPSCLSRLVKLLYVYVCIATVADAATAASSCWEAGRMRWRGQRHSQRFVDRYDYSNSKWTRVTGRPLVDLLFFPCVMFSSV